MDDTKQNTQLIPPPVGQIFDDQQGEGGTLTQGDEQTLVQFPQSGQSTAQQSAVQAQGDDTSGGSMVHPSPEQEPVPSQTISSEFLAPSENGPEIEPDMEAVGIAESQGVPQIAEELQKVGVEPAKEVVPVPVAHPSLKSPIDLTVAENQTKGSFLFKDASSSLLWLAMLVMKQLRMKKPREEAHAA